MQGIPVIQLHTPCILLENVVNGLIGHDLFLLIIFFPFFFSSLPRFFFFLPRLPSEPMLYAFSLSSLPPLPSCLSLSFIKHLSIIPIIEGTFLYLNNLFRNSSSLRRFPKLKQKQFTDRERMFRIFSD